MCVFGGVGCDGGASGEVAGVDEIKFGFEEDGGEEIRECGVLGVVSCCVR